eukprot:361459-Chlamydomonas_euryale.AAC.1
MGLSIGGPVVQRVRVVRRSVAHAAAHTFSASMHACTFAWSCLVLPGPAWSYARLLFMVVAAAAADAADAVLVYKGIRYVIISYKTFSTNTTAATRHTPPHTIVRRHMHASTHTKVHADVWYYNSGRLSHR